MNFLGVINKAKKNILKHQKATAVLLTFGMVLNLLPSVSSARATVSEQNGLKVEKLVSNTQTPGWHDQVSANPGDIVEFKITFWNTSGSTMTNVIVRDALPAGLEYFPGHFHIIANAGQVDNPANYNDLFGSGINIASYPALGLSGGLPPYDSAHNWEYVELLFKAKVLCATTVAGKTMVNHGYVRSTQAGEVGAQATVTTDLCPVLGLDIEKLVSNTQTPGWHNEVSANPDDIVEFKITFKNTGNTTLQNVVVRDILPAGLEYFPGHFHIIANAGQVDNPANYNDLFGTGINIASYPALGLQDGLPPYDSAHNWEYVELLFKAKVLCAATVAGQTMINKGFVKATGVSEISDAATVTTDLCVVPSSDLEIEKIVSNTKNPEWKKQVSADPGDVVEFKITFKNTGNTTLQNVIVRDEVPSGLKYFPGHFTIIGHPGNNHVSNPANYNDLFGSGIDISQYPALGYQDGLPPYDAAHNWAYAEVLFKFEVLCATTVSGQTMVNEGFVRATGVDEISDTATVTTDICPPNPVLDLNIEKLVSHTKNPQWKEQVSADPGDIVEFKITFKNTGNTTLQNVVVRDALPAGLTLYPGYSKIIANGGRVNNPANFADIFGAGIDVTEYSALGLTSGLPPYDAAHGWEYVEVIFMASVSCATSQAGTAMVNIGYVKATGVAEKHDTATVTTRICSTKLEIEKIVSNTKAPEWKDSVDAENGDRVEFKITLKNTGETILHNVTVRDILPTGLAYYADAKIRIIKNSGETESTDSSALFGTGINIGDLAPYDADHGWEYVEVIFMATVDICPSSDIILTNTGYVKADGADEIGDSANVAVAKCTEGEVEPATSSAATKRVYPKKHAPEVLAATGPAEVFGASLYLGYLGFLLRRLRLRKYF